MGCVFNTVICDFGGVFGKVEPSEVDFLVRVTEWADVCQKRGRNRFSFFLDSKEQALAQGALKKNKAVKSMFFGGVDGAERCVLGIFPEWEEPDITHFPIIPVYFSFRSADKISHRDCLGAIMSMGLKRNVVGDILIGSSDNANMGVAFLYNTVAGNVVNALERIGRVGVKARLLDDGCNAFELKKLTLTQEFEEINGTVASLRTDALLSLAISVSRQKSAEILRHIGMQINHELCFDTSALLKEGDVFSIKGYGRFRLEQASGLSRSGRIHVIVMRYI